MSTTIKILITSLFGLLIIMWYGIHEINTDKPNPIRWKLLLGYALCVGGVFVLWVWGVIS